MRNIGRIQNLITFDTNAQRMYALITTSLDGCKSILYNPQTTRLAGYNGYKTRQHVFFKRRRNHIISRELHWLKIHEIIIVKILLLKHKTVYNTASEYLVL